MTVCAGPGGFLQYIMYNIPSTGFVKESMDAIVDGIVASIQLAHESVQPGNIFINQGMRLRCSVRYDPDIR